MRLLNTSTLVLHDPDFGDIPTYAILSHTWGPRYDEVSFLDLELNMARDKPGYRKITYACEQAVRDGYSWIWIDTCCINKDSSAELSEAINSMYAWYSGAAKCYAYLSDVHKDVGSDFPTSVFASSRWFTRSWTLQELIAPRDTTFFSRDWCELGTKQGLCRLISDITGISMEYLTGAESVDSASVAVRMSWASRRKSTRREDIAYSLMGLFGVNMPMLYGEGDKAFLRLQEEIVKISNDQSIFAWQDDNALAGDSHGLLADHPNKFVSCGDIVSYLGIDNSKPFSMTNKGLSINLPLIDYVDGTCAAALYCQRGNHDGYVGVYLKPLSNSERFTRVNLDRLALFYQLGRLKFQDVYIPQNQLVSRAVYPSHVFHICRDPHPSDGYVRSKEETAYDLAQAHLADARTPDGLSSGHRPMWLSLVKAHDKASAMIIYKRLRDGERVAVVLGSTKEFGMGFDAIALAKDASPTIAGLEFIPNHLGTTIKVGDHKVSVEADIKTDISSKRYEVRVSVYAATTQTKAITTIPATTPT